MKNKLLFYQLICILLIIIIGWLFFSGPFQAPADNKKETAHSLILNRKSVRNFTSRPVNEEDIQILLKSGMAAPSGKDIRPWEMAVINDRALLDRLGKELPTASMLLKAPIAIVVCGDTTRSFYWYLDCAAATQNILLAAESLGLGAVWTAAYPYEDRMETVIKHLSLPSPILPLAVIPIGYPSGPQHVKDKFDPAKIHINKW
jgi:Nitroreductase